MKKIIIVLVITVLVVIGFWFLGIADSNPSETETPSATVSESVAVTPTASPVAGDRKTFDITATDFSFSLSSVVVNKGDTVTIVFTNENGMHDWVIDEFNARTSRIQSGQTAQVTFVADKTGQFKYYCSVGNHRARGMEGTLIVQ